VEEVAVVQLPLVMQVALVVVVVETRLLPPLVVLLPQDKAMQVAQVK
jgi:hypothetical protein